MGFCSVAILHPQTLRKHESTLVQTLGFVGFLQDSIAASISFPGPHCDATDHSRAHMCRRIFLGVYHTGH